MTMTVAELISELTNECRLRGMDPRDMDVYVAQTVVAPWGQDLKGCAPADRVDRSGKALIVSAAR